MDPTFLWLRLPAKPQKPQTLGLFANSSRWFHKTSKVVKMMPKMFVVLTLLARGAVSVRSGTSLSEGQLELRQGDEKWEIARVRIQDVFDEFGISATPRQVKTILRDVREIIQHEFGISATPRQVKTFLRNVWAAHPDMRSLERIEAAVYPDEDFRVLVKLYLPLDVGASAVAFCGELVKEAKNQASARGTDGRKGKYLSLELLLAEEICSQVLTGNVSKTSFEPEWAVKASEVAEMDGQQHPYGRLDGVAWKQSLKRVCHDECEELVKGIQDKAEELAGFADVGKGTIENACADEVVRHVEAEILGCCSKSCGWNGQFCAFFPFLNSTQQADWQAECCSERNILNGSTRQQMCDSTLSEADKNMSQNLTDQRPNNEEDREILGQDESPASNSVSLMERSFGGSVDHNTCPPPIDLHKIYNDFFQDWKRMPLKKARKEDKYCEPNDQPSRGKCKAFLLKNTTDDEGRKKYIYNCWDACGWKRPKNPESLHVLAEKVKDEVLGIGGNLFVHKEIYSAWKWT